MLRRAMQLFCMPCSRREEDVAEEYRLVAVADDDPVLLDPKEPHVVLLSFRVAPRHVQAAGPRAGESEMVPSSPGVGVQECPSLQDTQREERTNSKVSEPPITSSVPLLHSRPDDGASSALQGPAASRRIRGCKRCWAERLANKMVVQPHGRTGYRLAPR